MSMRKSALLLVPVLLVVACASVAFAGNVVDYTYDADGNITDANTSTATSVHISANPASIQPGGTATLSWTSTNANSCSIDQGIGAVPLNGSMPSPLLRLRSTPSPPPVKAALPVACYRYIEGFI